MNHECIGTLECRTVCGSRYFLPDATASASRHPYLCRRSAENCFLSADEACLMAQIVLDNGKPREALLGLRYLLVQLTKC